MLDKPHPRQSLRLVHVHSCLWLRCWSIRVITGLDGMLKAHGQQVHHPSPITIQLVLKHDLSPTYIRCIYPPALVLVSAQLCLASSYTQLPNFSPSTARWPSGLRRQLKVLPIRWSERAWVQIPLSSLSFCP
jgi:hypothetical protein